MFKNFIIEKLNFKSIIFQTSVQMSNFQISNKQCLFNATKIFIDYLIYINESVSAYVQ